MYKPALRNKSITTKVTAEEYARLERLAEGTGRSMSEWMRSLLQEQLDSQHEIILAEILALRNIVVNLAHTQNQGQTLNLRQLKDLLAAADAIKRKTAIDRLTTKNNKGAKDGITGTH